MNKIFLGPLFHWIVIVGLIAFGWYTGAQRFHASNFNPFIIALIVIVIVTVIAVILTSRPGQPVTRDPIEEPEGDAD